ncbi:hydrophobin-251 [Amanita rubescens]|nr:hydrophobin-251 [Amanita rubescens]
MFSKLAVVATVAFAIFAAAAPTPGGSFNCSTGTQKCCNSVQDAKSPEAAGVIAGLLGVGVGQITGMVGLNCIDAIPILGGSSCDNQAACCKGNNFNGAVVLGCTPINVN